jgi:hypothetical protein
MPLRSDCRKPSACPFAGPFFVGRSGDSVLRWFVSLWTSLRAFSKASTVAFNRSSKSFTMFSFACRSSVRC